MTHAFNIYSLGHESFFLFNCPDGNIKAIFIQHQLYLHVLSSFGVLFAMSVMFVSFMVTLFVRFMGIFMT